MKFFRRLFCTHDYEREPRIVSNYLDHAYCHCTYKCKRCGKSYQKFEWLKYVDSYLEKHPLDTSAKHVNHVMTDWKYFRETEDCWRLAIAQNFIMKYGTNDQREWMILQLRLRGCEYKWV